MHRPDRNPRERSSTHNRQPRRPRRGRRRVAAGTRIASAELGARARLKRFRRATALAVAMTGLLLLLFGVPTEATPQDSLAPPADTAMAAADTSADPAASVQEATGTLRQLGLSLYEVLPKLAVVLALLLVAGLLLRLVKTGLRRLSGSWERADALSALVSVVVWILALGAALSVVAGDVTALVGSVGLFGLALSWALQAPIESFTGWLLNSFRGYYRVGDRIEVGNVFGDVARIDALTTTVWEAGGPEKAVQAAQPTGALVTFPNSEVLRANIINYTRDFPFVWDEVTLGVANGSELRYAVQVIGDVARQLLGEVMSSPAEAYGRLLKRARLDHEIGAEPQVYVSTTESYTNITVRYLVPARERRVWATRLVLALTDELRRPEHRGRIEDGYPRRQIEMVATDTDPTGAG